MTDTEHLMALLRAVDGERVDATRLRRLAYEACDGDAVVLMTTLLRTIRSLAEQLAPFYGTTLETVLRMEVVLPT